MPAAVYHFLVEQCQLISKRSILTFFLYLDQTWRDDLLVRHAYLRKRGCTNGPYAITAECRALPNLPTEPKGPANFALNIVKIAIITEF